jgi:hypothetical protein
VARAAFAAKGDHAHVAGNPPTSGIELLTENGEKMPTDKLLDISPQALRMSSPFNAGYWTTA